MPNNTRFKTRPSFKIAIEGQPDLETTNFMTNQKRLQTSSRQRQSEFSKLSRFDTDSDSSTENEPEIRMQRSRRRLQGGTRHSFTNLPSDQMFSDLPMPLYSSDVQGCLPGSVEDVKQLY
ncbi:hypothetical protein MAR_018543 [Mya arenaria]|uniref:Uncharacterized protein n=2 Tax=Mya arenaria TaxID=6604 RepID=A0ABY7EEY3_MYAAR|nr:hypothetical protein MAR_018543 [Mya arenaria]